MSFFYNWIMLSAEAMYWYDTTKSKWIDFIARSKNIDEDGNVIVAVKYTNQKGYTNGILFFYVSLEEYMQLKDAESTGSEYYHNWSIYGTPKQKYGGGTAAGKKDNNNNNNNNNNNGPNPGPNPGPSPDLPLPPSPDPTDNVIDGDTLNEAKENFDADYFDEWAEEKGYDDDTKETIKNWVYKIDGSIELLEQANELRRAIMMEQLGFKKAMKLAIRDLEGIFGISITQKAFYDFISSIGQGELNPTAWIKYKYKIDQFYILLEQDGLKGASEIGKRMMMSKNPLIRERKAYRTYQEIKKAINGPQYNWLEGKEAEAAIRKFHTQALNEAKRNIIRRNSQHLVQRTIMKDGKKITQVRWARNISKERIFIVKFKKALRIVKGIFFL